MRRLASLLAAGVLVLAVAGPAAAVPPTIGLLDFPQTFISHCGDVEVVGTVTLNKVTEYTFYDRDGNVTRYMVRGPLQYEIVAPNGNSLSTFSNAMFIMDFRNGRVVAAGVQLFGSDTATWLTAGQYDYNTGTLRGVLKDLCPALGYPAA